MKYLLLIGLLATTATPRLESTDPYAKYDLVISKAQSTIVSTKASIEEAKAMTDAKVVEMHEAIVEAEVMAEKVELLQMVCDVYSIPVPESIEEFETERREDSIRVSNMKKINEKGF